MNKKPEAQRAGGSSGRSLFSKYKTLSSNPITEKKKQKQQSYSVVRENFSCILQCIYISQMHTTSKLFSKSNKKQM
jgi:hypothetical protein